MTQDLMLLEAIATHAATVHGQSWRMAHQAHPAACRMADRHYSRKTVGASQMMPPGRQIVLITLASDAVWGASWPRSEMATSDWSRDAWLCTIFRNEGAVLSSELVREAVEVTRWYWGDPPANGYTTFVDAGKTRRKRDPGRCFRKAGFEHVGFTKGGLYVLRLPVDAMPEARAPLGTMEQMRLDVA